MLIYYAWVCSLTFDSEKFRLWVEPSNGVRAETHSQQVRWIEWFLFCFPANKNTDCFNLEMLFLCTLTVFKCLTFFDFLYINPAVFFSSCWTDVPCSLAANKCDSHIALTSHPALNFQTDLFMMETEQTAASCHAPGQTSVRTWLSSSIRGTNARLLLTARIGSQTKISSEFCLLTQYVTYDLKKTAERTVS